VSKLPDGWSVTPLDNLLTTIEAGRSFKCSERPAKPDEWGVIKVSAMTWGEFSETENKAVLSDRHADPRFEIHSGDLLFSRANTVAYVGAVVQVGKTRPRLLLSDKSLRLVPRRDVSPRWLLYYLRTQSARRYLESTATGTSDSMRNISQTSLRNLSVPIAPLREQGQIVAAIEEQFSRLDAGLASLERAWENLRHMRASVYTAAVTGRLTSPVEVLSTVDISRDFPLSLNLTPENSRKVKRSTEDLLGRVWNIPSTWAWKPAVEVCESIASGSTPTQAAMTPDKGEIPYIKVYNLTQAGHLDFSVKPTFIDRVTHETILRRSRLIPGDILMNIVGPPLGKISVVPGSYPEWNTNQAVVSFRPIKSLHPNLLKYWLLSPPVIKVIESTAKATSGQYNVSLTTCRALPLPIPPRDDQDLIVASIEERISMIDSQEEVIKASIARAFSLRSAILSAAFSGKLI
jgi:type I restriction enzyme S subunit